MKKIMTGLLISMLVSGVLGCATQSARLRNAGGETVECKGSEGEVEACKKKYEAAGYTTVEEPGLRHGEMGGGSGY